MLLLAADIGGTKTRVALCRVQKGRVRLIREARFSSRTFPGLAAILKEFLSASAEKSSVVSACFGVAGPVANGRCEGTNLPWIVDAKLLERAFDFRKVVLINDLQATAYGIEALPAQAFATLQKGKPVPQAPIAVLAAGTGLGEGVLVWDGARYQAIASEGGHADFAPRAEKEVELWRYLSKKFGHVSYERILSGPGKLDIYYFLRDFRRYKEPAWLREALSQADASVTLSEIALKRRSAVCVEALQMFVSLYGAEAGNLALKTLARGGVYIGGGIAPSILPFLKDGTFIESFRDKGRLSPLLAEIPVRVILDDKAALCGAARCAMQAASGKRRVKP